MSAPKETSNHDFIFDARWVGDHGIGRFASEVLSRLPRVRLLESSFKPTHPLDVLFLSVRMLIGGDEVSFSPGYNAPLLGLDRYVFTIHDLNHIDQPANSTLLKRLYYRLVMRPACRRAARILTVSEYSRSRIAEWAGINPSRIVNVGNGVSPLFSPHGEWFLPGYPYLLCMGNRKGHKNENRLLSAFAASRLDPRIRLAFSGSGSDELRLVAEQLGVTERLVFLGRIEEKMLPAVYRGALALLFPSLYEGFGLPLLEAMACGTPVVTSNVTSLPEVAGDAAILVDPTDVIAISQAIELVVQDQALRNELSRRGLERVKAYSWENVASRVRAVLDDAAVTVSSRRKNHKRGACRDGR